MIYKSILFYLLHISVHTIWPCIQRTQREERMKKNGISFCSIGIYSFRICWFRNRPIHTDSVRKNFDYKTFNIAVDEHEHVVWRHLTVSIRIQLRWKKYIITNIQLISCEFGIVLLIPIILVVTRFFLLFFIPFEVGNGKFTWKKTCSSFF